MGDDIKNSASQNKAKKQNYKGRTIYILYIPGGGVQGIIPGVMLSRLEELTEISSTSLFQVLNGVSTGSLITGGIAIPSETDKTKPRYLASNITEMFCYWSGRFFPNIPGRFSKYVTATLFNYIQDATNPANADRMLINAIRNKIKDINLQNNDKPAFIQDLLEVRRIASEKYFSKRMQKRAARICESLMDHDDLSEDAKNTLEEINGLILARRPVGFMTAQFNKAANCSINATKALWAKNYMYDPAILENMLRDHIGEFRMKDSLKSLYISSYDLKSRRMITFFNRKEDFFSQSPDAPCETSENNEKIWDAIMASTANPFAYPPHETEDGILCSDKAVLHTPLPCVEDVLKHKPEGVNVKLIYMGTGKLRYTPEEDKYDDYNAIRSLVEGRELDDLYRYNSTAAREIIREKIGFDNFIEFNPFVTAAELDDLDEMPSPPNSMDASGENIKKILSLSRNYIKQDDVDRQIKALAVEMSENLYHLGHISEHKLERIRKRCGQDNGAHNLHSQLDNAANDNALKRFARRITHNRWFTP